MSKVMKQKNTEDVVKTFKFEFDNFIKTYYVEPVDLVKNIDNMEEQFNLCNKFYIALSEISNELRNKRDQFQGSIKDIFARKAQQEQTEKQDDKSINDPMEEEKVASDIEVPESEKQKSETKPKRGKKVKESETEEKPKKQSKKKAEQTEEKPEKVKTVKRTKKPKTEDLDEE